MILVSRLHTLPRAALTSARTRRAAAAAVLFLAPGLALAAIVLAPAAADAYSVSVSASYAAGVDTSIEPGLLQGSDTASTTSPFVSVDASVDSGVLALDPFTTSFQGSAHAIVDSTTFGVAASISIDDRDLLQSGKSVEAFAFATYEDQIWASAAESIFLSPILQLTGSLDATPDLRSTLSMSVTSPGFTELFRMRAPSDGNPIVVDEQVMGPALALAPGSSLFLRISLSGQATASFSSVGAGGHAATVDFDESATLLGFAVFADAEMTQPLPDVVLTSEAGFTYQTISVPEPATGWLLTLGFCAAGACSRGRRPAATAASRRPTERRVR